MRKTVLGMILAGGEGRRLQPLTIERAKPSVPFGGKYRIIDFVLSNMVNSGIQSIFVLTQFKSQSLTEHIINGWNISSNQGIGRFIIPVPAQMQTQDKRWYSGTADAIYQNSHLISDFNPDLVALFGGDHIYRMDISQMIKYHIKKSAIATVSVIPVLIEDAKEFGVVQIDEDWRIIGFQEKPEEPACIPGDPEHALVSMGNYIFNTSDLLELLKVDCLKEHSSHDFGKDILPGLVDSKQLYAYNFERNRVPGVDNSEVYWKDVGNLKAYYEANMDLRANQPKLDLYNKLWPIYNYHYNLPPAKFVHNDDVSLEDGLPRIGKSVDSLVCDGCIISGATVINSILFNCVHIHSYTTVHNSIILSDVNIDESCRIKNAIVDKHVSLPKNTIIGYNREDDEARYHVTDLDKEKGTWLTVVPKDTDSPHRKVAKMVTPV